MTGQLTSADIARLARAGTTTLPTDLALALFDTALANQQPLLVPARLNTAALRARAESGDLPAVLRGLIRATSRHTAVTVADTSTLTQRLTSLPEVERHQLLLGLVGTHAATVLGHPDPTGIDPTHPFKDIGFDSLTAVELRNRLATATGLRLPATLAFDYPTPGALSSYLHTRLFPATAVASAPILAELDKLEAALSGVSPDDVNHRNIATRLRALVAKWSDTHGLTEDTVTDKLQSATADEIFDFIDKDLGRSAPDRMEPSTGPRG
jgi:polyketide synthase 12